MKIFFSKSEKKKTRKSCHMKLTLHSTFLNVYYFDNDYDDDES